MYIYTHTPTHTRVEQILRWCTQIVLYIVAHTNMHVNPIMYTQICEQLGLK